MKNAIKASGLLIPGTHLLSIITFFYSILICPEWWVQHLHANRQRRGWVGCPSGTCIARSFVILSVDHSHFQVSQSSLPDPWITYYFSQFFVEKIHFLSFPKYCWGWNYDEAYFNCNVKLLLFDILLWTIIIITFASKDIRMTARWRRGIQRRSRRVGANNLVPMKQRNWGGKAELLKIAIRK